ncbi:MAG TPA: hypothetical protein VFT59_05730 [Candidatus Saccharimonadales bacterium]|nr:hypothetical protein [Candidatus Saccharimonadales bacterium]
MQKTQERPPDVMTRHFMQEMLLDEDIFYASSDTYTLLDCSRVYYQYLYSHKSLSRHQKIGGFVASRRLGYRLAWSDYTAHELYRPLPLAMPESYGQCVPLSCTLLDELNKEYPEERFALNSGRVLMVNETTGSLDVVMPAHVWITWHGGLLAEDIVIDTTADQSQKLPPIVMSFQDDLVQNNIVYHGYRSFSCGNDLLAKLEEREPEVRKRVSYFTVALEGLRRYTWGERLSHIQNM